MNRIDYVFNKLKEENKKALIPFIANGDPTLDKTVEKSILNKENISFLSENYPIVNYKILSTHSLAYLSAARTSSRVYTALFSV